MPPAHEPRAVERRARLTPAEFERYAAANQPVVITGMMEDWNAVARWNAEYLKAQVGDVVVSVASSQDKIYRIDPASGAGSRETMTAGEYLDMLFRETEGFDRYYLQQKPYERLFPSLVGDISTPPYFQRKDLLSTTMWIGPTGSLSPLHYDMHPNLLAQVLGRKQVLLFSPHDSPNLYPHPATSIAGHLSTLCDATTANLEQFPRLAKATVVEAELGRGEMLFIPCAWWHQVRTIETSISINFWWKRRWEHYLLPSVLRMLAAAPIRSIRKRLHGHRARSA